MIAFYRQKVKKNEMTNQIALNGNEMYQYGVLKVANLNRSTKVAWTGL